MEPFHGSSYFIHKIIFSRWVKKQFHHLHLCCVCRWCSSQVSARCIWEKVSNVNISYQHPQGLVLLHRHNDAFSITEPSPRTYWDIQYYRLGSVLCVPPHPPVVESGLLDTSHWRQPVGKIHSLVKGWNAAYRPVCLKLLISDKCH